MIGGGWVQNTYVFFQLAKLDPDVILNSCTVLFVKQIGHPSQLAAVDMAALNNQPPQHATMPLRNGTVVGQVVLQKEYWPRFEQGVELVFNKCVCGLLMVHAAWCCTPWCQPWCYLLQVDGIEVGCRK